MNYELFIIVVFVFGNNLIIDGGLRNPVCLLSFVGRVQLFII